jgi:hypothetical protein
MTGAGAQEIYETLLSILRNLDLRLILVLLRRNIGLVGVSDDGDGCGHAGRYSCEQSGPHLDCGLALFNAVCIGGGSVSSILSFRFDPGAGANATSE